MNRNVLVRALWQSLISAIFAGIIYTIIFAITSQSLNGFIGFALLVAGITFVVAFILNIFFSTLFRSRRA